MKIRQIVRAALLPLAMLALVACADSTTTSSSNLQVTLAPAPEGADGDSLAVTVLDAEGNPVTDAQVSLEGNMNHAGMVPVITDPVSDGADGAQDGVYHAPFEFTMMGDWIVSVTVERGDETEQVDIEATVTGDGITVK